MTGLLGGVFDPPHNGHVALLRDARAQLGFSDALLFVVAAPGHKAVVTDPESRLALAHAAFPGERIEIDRNPRTIETLRERQFDDPIFLIGADEFVDFPSWREPDEVLALTELGVGTRPGYTIGELDVVRKRLAQPDRVRFFETEAWEVSSSEIRDRAARGEPIDDLVPVAVAAEIDRRGLYRGDAARR